MKHVRLWLDEESMGSGFFTVLHVKTGREKAYFLYVPRLVRIEVLIADFERQRRSGAAAEVETSRGLIGRIEESRRAAHKYNRRFSEAFVAEALEIIRAEKEEVV